MYDDTDEEFGELLQWLQRGDFRLVIVEGARGSGKSTLIKRLLDRTSMVYYKTWGDSQKWSRHDLAKRLGLELPQATYFVLDFLKQVDTKYPVLADRGNLSALAYQKDRWLFTEDERRRKLEVHQYYVGLMREVRACLLFLSVDEDELVYRRVGRGAEDEQHLHMQPAGVARRTVQKDIDDYNEALDAMIAAGLREEFCCSLAPGATCYGFLPEGES